MAGYSREEPSPDVSVLIVTYQSRDFVHRCLDAIRAQGGPPLETIVVDNASADGTADQVAEMHPEVSLTQNSANLGFAAGVNRAAQQARGRYLLLLNPDTEVPPGTLATLTAFMNGHPEVAAVGPRLIYPDGTAQDAAFSYPSLLMHWLEFFPRPARLLHTRWNGRLDARDDQPVEIDHPLGACMLIRRAAWDEIGPLDEGFFMYCEEVDWCMRAKRAGWRIMQVPTATVVHQSGASSTQTPTSIIHLYASRRRLHQKHRGPLFKLAAAFITRIGLMMVRRRLIGESASGNDPTAGPRLEAVEQLLHETLV
ncbi:MAG: glycosyltransferase family 2 protein [Chloroflexi bacterium]|nr:glycosyltransferase family 2 protein [Chloroflexota bacterium]